MCLLICFLSALRSRGTDRHALWHVDQGAEKAAKRTRMTPPLLLLTVTWREARRTLSAAAAADDEKALKFNQVAAAGRLLFRRFVGESLHTPFSGGASTRVFDLENRKPNMVGGHLVPCFLSSIGSEDWPARGSMWVSNSPPAGQGPVDVKSMMDR